WASASALSSAKFDVGAYEMENVLLIEVDTQGRRRTEVFAAARLSDAVARLYERYADLLPDGPARARAAATARSVAGLLGSIAADRSATALAPAVKYTDHRPIGFGSLHGAENLVRGLDALLEIADDVSLRVDDVLDLRPDALIVRDTQAGTVRAS